MILDGKYVRDTILNEVKEKVFYLNVKPKLVVIQVGNDESSNIYINQKKKMCEYVGYLFEYIRLDDDITTEKILDIIGDLNDDDSVTGILVQLPLPKQIDIDRVMNGISFNKDVDGLCEINQNNLVRGIDSLYPCTVLGVMELLSKYNISVRDKNVVVIGRSKLVGKPLSMLLEKNGALVNVCHSKTEDLCMYTRNADILISAVGKPKLITGDMVKTRAVLIDIGINRVKDKICGDIDFDLVRDKCSYITPVPGGVGPMTIAMLAKNLLKAYIIQNR